MGTQQFHFYTTPASNFNVHIAPPDPITYESDVALCYQNGSYMESLATTGNIFCSFEAAGRNSTTSSGGIGTAVSGGGVTHAHQRALLGKFFEAAAHAYATNSGLKFWIAIRDDVASRPNISRVLGGEIRPIDNRVIHRFRNVQLYAIAYERPDWYETDGGISGPETDAIDGLYTTSLTDGYTVEGLPISNYGRLDQVRIGALSTLKTIDKVWLGVHDDPLAAVDSAGTAQYDINIDPGQVVIIPESAGVAQYTDPTVPEGTATLNFGDFDGQGWANRFYIQAKTFNGTTKYLYSQYPALANLRGRYLLLMRYALSHDPQDTEIGVHVRTFFEETLGISSEEEEESLEETPDFWILPSDYAGAGVYKTEQLGLINIGGGEAFANENTRSLTRFCIGLVTNIQGSTAPNNKPLKLLIKRLMLVPADRYVVVEPDKPVGRNNSNEHVFVETDEMLNVTAANIRKRWVMTDATHGEWKWNLETPGYVIEESNWTSPWLDYGTDESKKIYMATNGTESEISYKYSTKQRNRGYIE